MMGILFLIIAYANSFYFMIANIVGFYKSGIYYIAYSSVLLAISVGVVGYRIVINNFKLTKEKCLLIMSAVFIVVSFGSVYFWYNISNSEFNTAFLTMGVRVIPALLIGSVFDIKRDFDKLIKWIPVFVSIYTLAVVLSIIRVTDLSIGVQSYNNAINTYQSLSYAIAYAFSLTLLWVGNSKNKFLRVFMICLMPIQLYCLLALGGKGAFVVTGVVIIYFLFDKRYFLKGILLISFLVPLGFIVKGDILMTGINRLISLFLNFGNDKSAGARIVLFTDALKTARDKILFGHGLGSVYYTLGMRSHNIFGDILVEAGIFGIMICIFLLFYVICGLRKMSVLDYKYRILVIIFMSSFIMLLFSGYYLNETGIWLISATVISNMYRITRRKKSEYSLDNIF